MLDRRDRRKWINWPMIAVGLMMVSMGRYAIFGSYETLFTSTLARLGVESMWGFVLITVGGLNLVAVFIRNRTLIVATYGISAIALFWTWVIAYLIGGIYTPTVENCLWVGCALLVGTAYEANTSKQIRCIKKEAARNVNTSN